MKDDELNTPSNQDRQDRPDLGASMVEYAILIMLVALICLVSLRLLGHNLSSTFSRVTSEGFR